ncbi:MAG: DUF99 family protein [Deltaproteobacteria bacterium]|nr:DUF99 family protein [Deltaproteobacteria bacterium]
MIKHFSNVIGFDDAPFPAGHRGTVQVVGTIFARLQMNGILIGRVKRDGTDAAEKLTALISQSKFAQTLQLIMLQGISLAGFNVVDVFFIHAELGLPLLVVSRRRLDMVAIRDALLKMRGGRRKWALIERLGPMEPVAQIYVQRLGLTLEQAATVVRQFSTAGHIPEPLRMAHLIAGAIVTGESSGRV